MPELIDRQALIKDMCNNKAEAKCPCYPNCYPCDFSEARRIIDIQPTIEPEVRHGDWNTIYSFDGDVYFRCSNCEEEFVLDDGNPKSKGWKYCPSCGCKMDGGAGNG